jgi:hypothetical protein
MVNVYDNNIQIADSYKISKHQFDKILNDIVSKYPNHIVIQNRNIKSIKNEWAVHNLLYALHIKRTRTGSVDINWPINKYASLLYNILGPISLLFIR